MNDHGKDSRRVVVSPTSTGASGFHKLITPRRIYPPRMISDGEESRSNRGGLGEIGEGHEFRRDSLPKQFLRQFRRRWKILGSIVVTAVTTAAIYQVDGSFSKDAIVFATLTAALLLYAILTIWSDLQLE